MHGWMSAPIVRGGQAAVFRDKRGFAGINCRIPASFLDRKGRLACQFAGGFQVLPINPAVGELGVAE